MFFSNLEKIAIAQVSFRMIAADGKVDHEERCYYISNMEQDANYWGTS